ncbi:unnamed protein product, partial [Cuscuta europaea]
MANPEPDVWKFISRSVQRLKQVTQLMKPRNAEAVQSIRELMSRPLESFGDIIDYESDSYNVSRGKNL